MRDKLADSERAAFEAHIKSLQDEVAFLRGLIHPTQPVLASEPAMASGNLWTSEDEEDAQELLDAGLIDSDQFKEMMEAAGALNTDIEFHTP